MWVMYHGFISGWVGNEKISVSCIGGTRYQCPGVEVGLRFLEPCGMEGRGRWEILGQMSRRGIEIPGPVYSRVGDTRILVGR